MSNADTTIRLVTPKWPESLGCRLDSRKRRVEALLMVAASYYLVLALLTFGKRFVK